MSDYVQITDFSAKDALATGDPNKKILGSHVDGELDAISTAIASKANSANPALSGTMSGNITISGNNTHSGNLTFSGTNSHSGVETFTAAPIIAVDDATTNAVTTVHTLRHTTTGTPANNIGVGQNFEVETSAGNTEIGAKIEAIATDTTAASEDFKLSFKTMVAGAAPTEAGYVAQGLVFGSPTGTDKGAGTGNFASGVYDNGSRLSHVLIDSKTASSSASIAFTTGINSTFDEYEIHIVHAIPATDNVTFYMRSSTDGGVSYAQSAGDYIYVHKSVDTGGTDRSGNNSTTATAVNIATAVSSTANRGGVNSVIRFYKPSNATHYKRFKFESEFAQSATEDVITDGVGTRVNTADIDAIGFIFSSGNIASGEFYLYGIRKS